MDFCLLKNAELAEHLQKSLTRVVPWIDNVKDEEEYRAVVIAQDA